MKNKLLSNSIFYSLIGLLPVAIGFFTLPILTRYLSPEEYGILSMIAAFTTMVSIIATFQIYSGVSRIYFDYNEENRKVYFSTLFFAISAISLIVFIFFLIWGDIFIGILYSKSDVGFWPYFFVSILSIFFSLPVGITTAFFKVQEKGKNLLIISAISTIITVSLILYFVVIELMGVLGSLLGSAIGGFLTYILHVIYFKSNFIFRFDIKMFIENFKFGIPVIPHALGGYLFMYSDIIILEKYVAVAMIGIYAIADRFAQLLKTVVNSFANAFNPIFMKASKISIEEGQKIAKETSRSWFIILAVGYISLSHFGEYIIYIMTPFEYHEASHILPLLSLAYVFRGIYIMPINTFYFMKKTKYLPIATLTSGVFNVILNILLIPYIGIWGAALTTTISFAINWWLLELLSSKTFKIPFDISSLKFLILVIFISNIVFYLVPNDNLVYRFIIQVIFIGSTISFIWINDIGTIKEFIQKRIRK